MCGYNLCFIENVSSDRVCLLPVYYRPMRIRPIGTLGRPTYSFGAGGILVAGHLAGVFAAVKGPTKNMGRYVHGAWAEMGFPVRPNLTDIRGYEDKFKLKLAGKEKCYLRVCELVDGDVRRRRCYRPQEVGVKIHEVEVGFNRKNRMRSYHRYQGSLPLPSSDSLDL